MKAILIDITKCTGCVRCVQACCASNQLPPDEPLIRGSGDGLSAKRYASVVRLDSRHFARKQCLHCLDAGCVAACPVGAIQKTDEGPVVYDPSRCIGCRYCMLACPAGIPRYEWDKQIPYMKKCDMCSARLKEGKAPACVDACPNGALQFGDRDMLVSLATSRVESGSRYLKHVFGDKDFGGTSVLYISDRPLEALGFSESVGDRSIPSYTWPIISKTPWMAACVALFLGGTFIIRRRMELQTAGAPAESGAPQSDFGPDSNDGRDGR